MKFFPKLEVLITKHYPCKHEAHSLGDKGCEELTSFPLEESSFAFWFSFSFYGNDKCWPERKVTSSTSRSLSSIETMQHCTTSSFISSLEWFWKNSLGRYSTRVIGILSDWIYPSSSKLMLFFWVFFFFFLFFLESFLPRILTPGFSKGIMIGNGLLAIFLDFLPIYVCHSSVRSS